MSHPSIDGTALPADDEERNGWHKKKLLLEKPRAEEVNKELENKFRALKGITLYDSPASPCSRRVRMVLIDKEIPYQTVEVDLLKGEQIHPAFLKLNPNGKVPVLTIFNIEGLPNCVLYESNVITEFLDTVIPNVHYGEHALYPTDPWERARVKMWQDWELGLTDVSMAQRAAFPSRDALEATLRDDLPEKQREMILQTYDGTYRTEEELSHHAIGCYQSLLELEKALNGQDYLMDFLSIAEITLYPRLHQFGSAGLPIQGSVFPNISRYLGNLWYRGAVRKSEPMKQWVEHLTLSMVPGVLVKMGNFRSGKKVKRFSGSTVLSRVFQLASQTRTMDREMLKREGEVQEGEFLVHHYSTAAEPLQVQLLLMEKGAKYSTMKRGFVEMIGRPHGSAGRFRVRHGNRILTGSRGVLEYVDSVTGVDLTSPALYPKDPLLRAKCQQWQAWEQDFYCQDMVYLLERKVVAQKLHDRYDMTNLDELLALQNDVRFLATFLHIMKLYMSRVVRGTEMWEKLGNTYGHLVEGDAARVGNVVMYMELIRKRLEYLDQYLKNKDYLVGDMLTFADICVFCRLLFLPGTGVHISEKLYPNLATWMEALRQRENFGKIAEEVETNLGKFFIPEAS
ncbi:Tudor domain-containing protein 1 [Branchiostoma belcheri]|nr:Tudor domain-containing protein 1 [Branchiostoma belcheri]